ncbi:TMhelix containing protein [Vibrio phage 1.137.O._10N.261.46.B5]|nr:TMhelix containing protein [Vibrio phage 1.137.O._10N.261.46.B5]
MIEVLGGIVLTLIAALYFVYNSWQSERNKRSEVEEKVLAHEALQRVNEDIANGGDEYISSILRESIRTVRSDSTGNDISK